MAVSESMECEFKSPQHKLVRFFERSRNRWKAKHRALKVELKREQNQRRAVEKSRSKWHDRVSDLQQRVRQLEQELAEQKAAH